MAQQLIALPGSQVQFQAAMMGSSQTLKTPTNEGLIHFSDNWDTCMHLAYTHRDTRRHINEN